MVKTKVVNDWTPEAKQWLLDRYVNGNESCREIGASLPVPICANRTYDIIRDAWKERDGDVGCKGLVWLRKATQNGTYGPEMIALVRENERLRRDAWERERRERIINTKRSAWVA